MKHKFIIPAIALIIAATCATSCSSENDTLDNYMEEDVIASVDPIILTTEDSVISFNMYVEDKIPVEYVDSITFNNLIKDCVFDPIDRNIIKDISISDITMNADLSRAAYRKFFEVTSRPNGDWIRVTISCGRLKVMYDTKSLYEFPVLTSDLTKEYHLEYELSEDEYPAKKYVYINKPFELNVNMDIVTKKDDKEYDARQAGFQVRIINKKFQLMKMWGCD